MVDRSQRLDLLEPRTKICRSNWSCPELKANTVESDDAKVCIEIDVEHEMPSVVLYKLDNPDDWHSTALHSHDGTHGSMAEPQALGCILPTLWLPVLHQCRLGTQHTELAPPDHLRSWQ